LKGLDFIDFIFSYVKMGETGGRFALFILKTFKKGFKEGEKE